MSHCPNCGVEQLCPCSACKPRNYGKAVWVWSEDGNFIICAGCGMKASADWWSELSMDIVRHEIIPKIAPKNT